MTDLTEDPKLEALLLCTQSIRDEATRLVSLIGILSDVHCEEFPATYGPFCIYVRMANLNGRYALVLEFTRAADDAIVGEVHAAIDVRDPLVSLEIVLTIQTRIPGPGKYVLRLMANGRYIANIAFRAHRRIGEKP